MSLCKRKNYQCGNADDSIERKFFICCCFLFVVVFYCFFLRKTTKKKKKKKGYTSEPCWRSPDILELEVNRH